MGGLLEKVLMNVIDEGGGGKWGGLFPDITLIKRDIIFTKDLAIFVLK